MKIFIALSVLSLLFVIGSALAINAIGRNLTTSRRGQVQGEKNTDKENDNDNTK